MKRLIKFILIISFMLMAGNIKSESKTNHHDSILEKRDEQHIHDNQEGLETKEPSEHSIYNLRATWLTQDGRKIKLYDLRGKVQVVAMVYTSCQNVCPRIVSDMKRIESEIPEHQRDRVGFVLVSIDPGRDNPERMKAFALERGLDLKRWVLLSGDENSILELAALLGVKYKKESETDYAHSLVITVLNKKGEVVQQQVGLGIKQVEIKTAIENSLLSHH
jgi:protein SCO1/2